jgi:hypothetical protein
VLPSESIGTLAAEISSKMATAPLTDVLPWHLP